MAKKEKVPPRILTLNPSLLDVETVRKKYRFIVAFDPSLDGFGFSVLDCLHKKKPPKIAEMGSVSGRTPTWPKGTTYATKLALIQAKIRELRAKYDPIFPIVFAEDGFVKFKNDVKALYRVRGVMEAELLGADIEFLTPSEMKLFVAGHGHADKGDVANVLADELGIDVSFFDGNMDAADATGFAYYGYKKYYLGVDRNV
ncbi:hypothetical protein ACH2FV_19670 (plasmid) [Bacillus safensis subsp. safensis]|uniref:hypothetical protein n=1 Tax=Bacillus safensis TaxID=561879 RepID=UPI0037C0E01E